MASLVKFTNMNDIMGINWPIVHSFEPEKIRRNYFDRPHTREEFQQLVEKADYRNKAIILLMSSAGLRVGALPSIKLRDSIPIDKYNIYKVIVYAGSRKSQY